MQSKMAEAIKGKSVLFVPTYSMRSYETGLYDLLKDGNMARVSSFIKNSDAASYQVLVPKREKLANYDFIKTLRGSKGDAVKIISVPGYGMNAKETRCSQELCKYVKLLQSCFDIVIIEQQTVAMMVITDDEIDNDDFFYWCVASHIEGEDIWFVDEYKDVDRYIASMIKTACANEKQVEYLGGKSFVDFFYDVKGTFKPTVFFPFRLSDPEYCFYDKLVPFLDGIQETQDDEYDLLITDPNDSLDESKIGHQRPLVVSSDHRLYMSILKGKPIIPYFAKVDVIRHISIEEMVQAGCCVICYDNDTYRGLENVHMAEDDEMFKQLLKHAIETEGR